MHLPFFTAMSVAKGHLVTCLPEQDCPILLCHMPCTTPKIFTNLSQATTLGKLTRLVWEIIPIEWGGWKMQRVIFLNSHQPRPNQRDMPQLPSNLPNAGAIHASDINITWPCHTYPLVIHRVFQPRSLETVNALWQSPLYISRQVVAERERDWRFPEGFTATHFLTANLLVVAKTLLVCQAMPSVVAEFNIHPLWNYGSELGLCEHPCFVAVEGQVYWHGNQGTRTECCKTFTLHNKTC